MHSTIRFAGLLLGLGVVTSSGAEPAADPAVSVPPRAANKVIRLEPYTVSATFPAIRVRFLLSRQNLFDPQGDPIAAARVTEVDVTDGEYETDLKPDDLLIALNGTPLAGLTLRQLAALVTAARAQNTLVWDVRRGLVTLQLHHNGDWKTPLPGLAR